MASSEEHIFHYDKSVLTLTSTLLFSWFACLHISCSKTQISCFQVL